jgi:Uma2 family endonuclease
MSTPLRRGSATLADIMPLLEREERVELIDGELVRDGELGHDTAPRGGHGRAQTKLGAQLDPVNRRGGPQVPGGWWLMSEVEVLYARTDEVFRHDMLGFRRDRHASCPDDWPISARPDWACEILSKKTARYDIVQKQRTLHLHEVPHLRVHRREDRRARRAQDDRAQRADLGRSRDVRA